MDIYGLGDFSLLGGETELGSTSYQPSATSHQLSTINQINETDEINEINQMNHTDEDVSNVEI